MGENDDDREVPGRHPLFYVYSSETFVFEAEHFLISCCSSDECIRFKMPGSPSLRPKRSMPFVESTPKPREHWTRSLWYVAAASEKSD